jgi:hypothetical protein
LRNAADHTHTLGAGMRVEHIEKTVQARSAHNAHPA